MTWPGKRVPRSRWRWQEGMICGCPVGTLLGHGGVSVGGLWGVCVCMQVTDGVGWECWRGACWAVSAADGAGVWQEGGIGWEQEPGVEQRRHVELG